TGVARRRGGPGSLLPGAVVVQLVFPVADLHVALRGGQTDVAIAALVVEFDVLLRPSHLAEVVGGVGTRLGPLLLAGVHEGPAVVAPGGAVVLFGFQLLDLLAGVL